MSRTIAIAIAVLAVLALLAMFAGSLMALMKSQDEELLMEELRVINGRVNEFAESTRGDAPAKPRFVGAEREVKHE